MSCCGLFGGEPDCPASSCYEAGRDGFWVHRCLVSMDIESYIVEPASIEVNRKKRRAKTDRIDALLATQGITNVKIDSSFPGRLERLRTGEGKPLLDQMKARLRREFERLAMAVDQIRSLEMQQAEMIRKAAKEVETSDAKKMSPRQAVLAEHLTQLRGIGTVTAWTLSTEIFSWRDIQNRRQLAALAGLTPTPFASGDEEKEQGISKSGRGELRTLMIEIGWGWLHHQPQSELSKWYREKFGDGTKRSRKRGIVALARKLLVALGKYVQHGEIPAGAKLKKELKFNYTPKLKLSSDHESVTTAA